MNEYNQKTAEDELPLIKIIEFFKESWKQLVLCGIIGSLLGFGYASIIQYKYQATAFIQVGRFMDKDIETPNLLIEKLKMPMYFSKTTLTACNVIEFDNPGLVLVSRLSPTLTKNSQIISITYKDKSTEFAKNCLESVLNDVRTNQSILSQESIKDFNFQLSDLKEKLEYFENISKILPINKTSFKVSDLNFSASVLLLEIVHHSQDKASELKEKIKELEKDLRKPHTQEASLVTPIYAPSNSVEPKKSLIVLLGGIAGGVLAIAYLVGRRVWIKIKHQKWL